MNNTSKKFYRTAKRTFDILLSLCIMPPALFITITAALVIFTTTGCPVFFRQKRVGFRGEEFTIIKLRTMTAGKELGRGYLEKERITGPGGFLRVSHIDELPQLLLVLRGTMSFVGPRPLLREHLDSSGLEKRQSVKPGLMCLSQNKLYRECFLDTGEQLDLDLEYVDIASMKNDFIIIGVTIALHVKRFLKIV